MILLIDNYDSFTFNLVHHLTEAGAQVVVKRHDEITIVDIHHLNPQKIVISPGPGTPSQAGISIDVVKEFYQSLPILGVCLGHQAIAQAFGGRIVRAPSVMHGKTSQIFHDQKTIFQTLPNPFVATRYHSLIIDPASLPDELEISAWTEDKLIMGVRHKKYPVEGIQFHPESVLTVEGKKLLQNFLG